MAGGDKIIQTIELTIDPRSAERAAQELEQRFSAVQVTPAAGGQAPGASGQQQPRPASGSQTPGRPVANDTPAAMMRQATEAINRLNLNVRGFFQPRGVASVIANAAEAARGGAAASAGTGMASRMMAGTAGVLGTVGAVAGAVGIAAAVAIGVYKGFRAAVAASSGVLTRVLQDARYGGPLAVVEAQRTLAATRLGIQRSNLMGASAAALQGAEARFNQAAAPYGILRDQVHSAIATTFFNVSANFLRNVLPGILTGAGFGSIAMSLRAIQAQMTGAGLNQNVQQMFTMGQLSGYSPTGGVRDPRLYHLDGNVMR